MSKLPAIGFILALGASTGCGPSSVAVADGSGTVGSTSQTTGSATSVGDTDVGPCVSDEQCQQAGAGDVCIDGQCEWCDSCGCYAKIAFEMGYEVRCLDLGDWECGQDFDCGPTEVCLGNICEPADSCDSSSDCADRPCHDGLCRTTVCRDDAGCVAGAWCQAGVCADVVMPPVCPSQPTVTTHSGTFDQAIAVAAPRHAGATADDLAVLGAPGPSIHRWRGVVGQGLEAAEVLPLSTDVDRLVSVSASNGEGGLVAARSGSTAVQWTLYDGDVLGSPLSGELDMAVGDIDAVEQLGQGLVLALEQGGPGVEVYGLHPQGLAALESYAITPGADRLRASTGQQTPRATLRYPSSFDAVPLGLQVQTFGFDADRQVLDAVATTDVMGEVVAVAAVEGTDDTIVAGWRGDPAVPRFAFEVGGVLEVSQPDLLGDGTLDVVYAAGDALGLLVVDPSGTLDCMMVVPAEGHIRYVTFGDFDGDGAQDVAAVGDSAVITVVAGPIVP